MLISAVFLFNLRVKLRNVLIGIGIVFVVSVITVAIVQLERGAEFEVISIAISPEAEVGENITITVIVKNIGRSGGTYTAILFIDGVQVEAKDITISAGATRTVSFSLVKDVEGTYVAKVGKISKTFTVGIPIKIMAENCLLEQDNIIVKCIAITEMENVVIENLGLERVLSVDYYDEENKSPPWAGHTWQMIYQFSNSVEAHNFFEKRASIEENWASEENIFFRINVGNEGFYRRPQYERPETFFRIKNCVISFYDFRGEGTGKCWVYAIILSERFKPSVEVSWKKEKFEAEGEEFLLEKDSVIIKGMYIENYEVPEEVPGLERAIKLLRITYFNENGSVIIEMVAQFQDNDKAHESCVSSRKTYDYAIGPVRLGDEGYVFAFAPAAEMVPGIVFRVRNINVMLLSLYGPDNTLNYCRIIEEKCKY